MTAITLTGFCAKPTSLIPLPQKVSLKEEQVELKRQAIYYTEERLADEASYLRMNWSVQGQLPALQQMAKVKKSSGIWLSIDSSVKNPEGYRIELKKDRILIKGGSEAGVFYGIQTLLQEKAYQRFDRQGIYYFDTQDPERHPEPAGPLRRGKEEPMDFHD